MTYQWFTNILRLAAEQRSRLEEAAPDGSYLDAAQRALDEAAERRLQQLYTDYQDDINNYELLQKGTRNMTSTRTHTRTTNDM